MFRSSNIHSSNTSHSHSHSHTTSINLHGCGYPSKNSAPRPAVVPTTTAATATKTTTTATASSTTKGQHANLFPNSARSTTSINASSTVLSYKQATKGGTITGSSGNYCNTGGSLASHSHSHSHYMNNCCDPVPIPFPAQVPLPINTASLKKEQDEDHHFLGFFSLKASNTVHRNSNISGDERSAGEFNWTLDYLMFDV